MKSKFSEGERVICRKPGPHDGARGTIEDTWMGVALVYFENSSMTESVDCFESVQNAR